VNLRIERADVVRARDDGFGNTPRPLAITAQQPVVAITERPRAIGSSPRY
jgi:hypothetical protein